MADTLDGYRRILFKNLAWQNIWIFVWPISDL